MLHWSGGPIYPGDEVILTESSPDWKPPILVVARFEQRLPGRRLIFTVIEQKGVSPDEATYEPGEEIEVVDSTSE